MPASTKGTWRCSDLVAHKKQIESSRSGINNKWEREQEKKLAPSRLNPKREMLKDIRFNDIERENSRLLGRMYEINKRSSVNKAAATVALAAAAPARSASLPAAGSRSNARVRELQRIDAENQRLMKRLNVAKPSIQLSKFDEEHKVQQKLMRMRMQNAAPEPRKGRLPFDPFPPTPTANQGDFLEDECDELQRLQDRLRQQGDYSPTRSCGSRANPEADLEEEEGEPEDGLEADPGAESPQRPPPQMPGFAGLIPNASRDLAARLMAERFDDPDAADAGHGEEAVEYAKEAAAAAMRAAAAMDMNPHDRHGELSYGDVVAHRPPFGIDIPRSNDRVNARLGYGA